MIVEIYFDGSMQERRNCIANTLELRLSWTNPSILNLASTILTVGPFDQLHDELQLLILKYGNASMHWLVHSYIEIPFDSVWHNLREAISCFRVV